MTAVVAKVQTPFGLTFTPINYTGAPPQPRAPITDPTPSERDAISAHNKAAMQQQRDVQHAQRQATKPKGGFFSQLAAGLDDLAHQVEKSVDAGTRAVTQSMNQMVDDHAFNRFRKHFPQIVSEELLLDNRCKLLTMNGVVPGYLQITSAHLCFVGENQACFSIPLNEILSVQTAISTQAQGGVPMVVPLFDDRVSANALQIFTCGGQMLDFFEFWSLHATAATKFNDCLNVLDHQWRRCVQVPRSDVQYVPYQQFQQPTWTPAQPVQMQPPPQAPGVGAPPQQQQQQGLDQPVVGQPVPQQTGCTPA
eukprot:TRINITY_DN66122_c15_g1_i1.p1 TRINITY_DN66122_c15_g1~~TRINITY_DN66122_c15_g1_i1.p1  ORF type:complete len:308 (-),score=61.55 TRINITY_DN66122_c15_g1_i1:195-1118(-)